MTIRPAESGRLFTSEAVEAEIARVKGVLTNARLAWMFENCFPNTLDTTVRWTREDEQGRDDTVIYTGDIHAMWLRDSGAQVWPYVQLAPKDEKLRRMIAGVIRRQFKYIGLDPYANAFLDPLEPEPDTHWQTDGTHMRPEVYERKWEIDSLCYPIRLAYEYWKRTGDTSVFDEHWLTAMENILRTFREQQRKEGVGPYTFLRVTDRQLDTVCNVGNGKPVNPVGLIASVFRPSDDATTFLFLVPSNFFAVTSLRKAAEIRSEVNRRPEMAAECRTWAAYGKPADRGRNVVTSLELQSEKMEIINKRLQDKYRALEENEVRYEAIGCDDAEWVIVAFGSSARICSATVEMARAEGLKVGLLRPITLYPFPKKQIAELAARGVRGFLSAELNAGQMVEDVRLAVNGKAPVEHYGRQGGMLFNPDEVLDALKEKLINK